MLSPKSLLLVSCQESTVCSSATQVLLVSSSKFLSLVGCRSWMLRQFTICCQSISWLISTMMSRKDVPETPLTLQILPFPLSPCGWYRPSHREWLVVFGQGNRWSSLSHLALSSYPAAPLHTHQFGTDFYRERFLTGSTLHPVLGSLHFSLTCSVLNTLPLLFSIFWHSPSFSSYSTFPQLPFRVGKHYIHFYCTHCILAWLGEKPNWQTLIPVNLKLKCCWFLEFSLFKN